MSISGRDLAAVSYALQDAALNETFFALPRQTTLSCNNLALPSYSQGSPVSKTAVNVPVKSHTQILSDKYKRRCCAITGCCRTVKSRGVCQRHGAVARKCKVPGCDKQAQGNYDKMCSKCSIVWPLGSLVVSAKCF